MSSELRCWGSDALGILGNGGANTNSSTPIAVARLKAPQTITFNTITDKTFGEAAFNESASATSGLDVTFSSLTSATCSVSGATITIVAAGTCTIAADQAGNGNFLAAGQVGQPFNIAKASQSITFASQGNKTIGNAPFNVAATSSSGLAVSFASQTPSVRAVAGNTVTLLLAGTCTVEASQAGDGNFNAAASTSQSFTVQSSGGGGGGGCVIGSNGRVDPTLILLCLFALWRVALRKRQELRRQLLSL